MPLVLPVGADAAAMALASGDNAGGSLKPVESGNGDAVPELRVVRQLRQRRHTTWNGSIKAAEAGAGHRMPCPGDATANSGGPWRAGRPPRRADLAPVVGDVERPREIAVPQICGIYAQ